MNKANLKDVKKYLKTLPIVELHSITTSGRSKVLGAQLNRTYVVKTGFKVLRTIIVTSKLEEAIEAYNSIYVG